VDKDKTKRGLTILLALPLCVLLFLTPFTARASRYNWVVAGHSNPTPTESWTYYVHFRGDFHDIHYSSNNNVHERDHVTFRNSAGNVYRYFGYTRSFNGSPDQAMMNELVTAWNDFHSYGPP
jgi:hypothetical protein